MASEQEYLALFQKKVKNIRAGSGGEYMGYVLSMMKRNPVSVSISVLDYIIVNHAWLKEMP